MKFLVSFLSSASNGNNRNINPVFQRVLQMVTGLIWVVSITWTVYSLFQTTQEYITYRSDKKIVSYIQLSIEKNPEKYQQRPLTYGQGNTSYSNAEETLSDYFRKLSYFNPYGFEPNDVISNYEKAKANLGTNPFIEFILSFLVFIALGNFLWWTLLRGSFWLRYGSAKN